MAEETGSDPIPSGESLDISSNGGSHTTPHNVIVERANRLLEQMLDDPFLSDLPKDCSVENARSQLALHQGKAITININRYDGEIIPVIVLQGASVQQLMLAFQKKVQDICEKEARTNHISWSYVWQNYWLACGQTVLEDYQAKLTRYGVGNQAALHFIKKLKKKHIVL